MEKQEALAATYRRVVVYWQGVHSPKAPVLMDAPTAEKVNATYKAAGAPPTVGEDNNSSAASGAKVVSKQESAFVTAFTSGVVKLASGHKDAFDLAAIKQWTALACDHLGVPEPQHKALEGFARKLRRWKKKYDNK